MRRKGRENKKRKETKKSEQKQSEYQPGNQTGTKKERKNQTSLYSLGMEPATPATPPTSHQITYAHPR
jgi:hypothetical protein